MRLSKSKKRKFWGAVRRVKKNAKKHGPPLVKTVVTTAVAAGVAASQTPPVA